MKKVAYLGMFTAFALILSFLESLIPNIFPIPGFKLGLANFAVLLALYLFGLKEAVLVDLCRIILAALLFGSMFSLFYALSGATLAILAEFMIKKTNKFSPAGVSVVGAIFHNTGQFILALFIMKSAGLLYYFPFLMIAASVTGVLNGLLVSLLKDRLKALVKTGDK